MKPPDLTPECPRGHAPGTSADRRLVAVGLLLIGAPFLIGGTWSVMIADEAIGPLITFVAWIVMFLVRAVRAKAGIAFIEWFAVVGSLVMLQLLLDLHTRYLGDVVVAALHVTFGIAVAVVHWRERRLRRS